MKPNIKNIFLILFFVNLTYIQSSEPLKLTLKPNKEINLTGEDNPYIQIDLESSTYSEYINFELSTTAKTNPFIFIAKDQHCEHNRLYTGIQIVEPIYTFIKRNQIDYVFYVCVEFRNSAEKSEFNLTIKNENTASIPYDTQASYYISDNNLENMVFQFIPNEASKINENSNITFWVKGKDIKAASINDTELKEKQYDHGFVFFGSFSGESFTLNINSSIGDYVTIGSTIITDDKTRYMYENANEMMVATEQEKICIPILFPPHISHITGKLYTKKARTYFADNVEMSPIKAEEHILETNITNGIVSELNIVNIIDETQNEGYYCFQNTENRLMIFGIQMTNNTDIPLVHQPLVPGEIRRHFLVVGEYAIFYGMKPKDEAIEVNLNLKTITGFPKLYFDNCTTFPNCDYKGRSFQNLTNPAPSNMITVYSFYTNESSEYKEFNPTTSFQPIMIVSCGLGSKFDFGGESMICFFETSYFTNLDTIRIYEDSSFSQYLLQGEDDKYEINLEEQHNKTLYLDLFLFSGDADISFDNFRGEINKYYLSNKIFFTVHLDNTDHLAFFVNASQNSFYMVHYQFVEFGGRDDKNTIESGVNYITSKFLGKENDNLQKKIELINFKYYYNQSYLMTFYSPNCKFSLNWIRNDTNTQTICENDNIAQYIIEPNDLNYHQEKYNLFYSILPSEDDSEYPKKFCMVYASGLELSEKVDEWNGRDISLSEGVPHRYTFSKDHPFIFYSYHVSDISKTLVLNFRLIDKTSFNITIKINRKNLNIENNRIYRNSQLYIRESDFKGRCDELEVCTVLVSVEMGNSELERRVELTMYQIDSTPFYLEKNVVKQDVLHGNTVKHYYFEIVDEEYGDITLDFKRGSGFIYADVQKRELLTPMDNPDWRGLYRFPKFVNESLKFRTYGKKIDITKNDTKDCQDGCYVLISIVSNDNYYGDYIEDTVPFRISINPRIMKTDNNIASPKVKIDVNEFVVGDIVFGRADNRKYDYYTVTLPYESEYVLIDWQADSPSLIINVGTNRPTMNDSHFSFPPTDNDCVHRMNKTTILEKGGLDTKASLRGVTLTLGIYSDINDSIQSSPYAFKIFMPYIMDKETHISSEIIHIRSDQKVQCIPFFYKSKNICVFAVIFDDIDKDNSLVLLPRSQDESVKLEIFGKLSNAEIIETNNVKEIDVLTAYVFDNKNFKEESKYVYIDKIPKNASYFFIVTAEQSNAIIEVLSSTQLFYKNINIYPNPSTTQIFAVDDYVINLNFITRQDLLLEIVGVSGNGGFYWDEGSEKAKKEYYIDGYGDRLSLTTDTNEEKYRFAPLKVDPFPQHEKGGFIFYINYHPRTDIDYLIKNSNTEFNYRIVKMPLYYYFPINSDNSWTINFNFYDFGLKNEGKNIAYDTNLFNIWATVISEKDAIEARLEPEKKPKYDPSKDKRGIFDSTFGNIFLSSEDIKNKFKDIQSPQLFFSIDKDENIREDFSSLGFELNVFSDKETSGLSHVPEGIYINGKLSQSKADRHKLKYMLRCDQNRPFFRVEYAAISDFVKFALNSNPDSEENENFQNIEMTKKNGRHLITVNLPDEFFSSNKSSYNLYLIVFTKESSINEKLDSFSFKYLSKEINGFFEFLNEKNDTLTYSVKDLNYKINFSPIGMSNSSYYIKGIYRDGFIEGEILDTIAISESKGNYLQINDFNQESSEKITYEFKASKELRFIKVLVRVNVYDEKLFYLYKPLDLDKKNNPPEQPSGKKDSDNKTLFYIIVGVSSLLLVIIIILVIFIFAYRKKNQNLTNQVNKISFVESGVKERGDGNLLLGIND